MCVFLPFFIIPIAACRHGDRIAHVLVKFVLNSQTRSSRPVVGMMISQLSNLPIEHLN